MCIRNIDDHIRHNHFCDRQIGLNSKTVGSVPRLYVSTWERCLWISNNNDHNHFASMQDVSGVVVVSIYINNIYTLTGQTVSGY